MYVKHCFSAFACALTLGLATGGYAQQAKTQAPGSAAPAVYPITTAYPEGYALAAPALLTPSQVFHTAIPVKVFPHTDGPHALAITNQPIYRSGDTVGGANFDNTFIGTTDSAGLLALSDVLDDIYLPSGIAGTAGVTLTGFAAVASAVNSTPTAYGRLIIYDSIDDLNATNGAVNQLAMYDFEIDNLVPGSPTLGSTGVQGKFDIPVGQQIVLTHDLSATGNQRYGVATRFYTDATRTTISKDIGVTFVYDDGKPGDNRPTLGESFGGFFPDNDYSGNFQTPGKSGFSYVWQGAGYESNIFMELDGTSANNLTFDASGTLTFQGLPHGSPAQAVKITLTSTTSPTNKPLVFNITLNLADVKTGTVVTGQAGTYTLIGIPADTYNIDIKPANNPAADLLAKDITKQNLLGANATFAATTTTATGNIALEGVPDLSATSFNALPGTFTIGFYTPGSVTPGTPATPVYSATVSLKTTPGSANGSYSVSGIPFGTYDVIIKGAKNLAVKLPSVALTTPNATLADALLPAGDANNDDIVDTTDFGVLVGVYGSDSNVTGSGYDASADFNFDGIVDTSDFGLLVGEYGNQGPL